MRGIYILKKNLPPNSRRLYVMMPVKRGDTNLIVDKTIQDSARMPLSVCRGTERQRYAKAQRCSDKLKEKLEDISNGKRCSVEKFKEALNSVLGENKIVYEIIDFKKKKTAGKLLIGRDGEEITLPPDANGRVFTIKNCSCDGHILCLPLTKDKKYIKNKFVALHEARHLFDYVYNPKMLVERYINAGDSAPESVKAYNNIVSLADYIPRFPYIPINIKNFKKSVSENLKILDDDMAIDALQNARNSLKTERNAYIDDFIYMRKHPLQTLVYLLDESIQIMSSRFQKRLDVINELLKERLQKAREN